MNNTNDANTTINTTTANTNDWCDACTMIGGYCGGACNGAYEWYKGVLIHAQSTEGEQQ